MHVKFTHFCITQPQFRRCLLFWFLLEKELFILKKEYLMLKERTQWLVKLSKLVPDTFCWLLLRKKKLTERRIYSSSVLDISVLLWGTENEDIRLPSCEIPKYSTGRLTNIFLITGHTYHDWKYWNFFKPIE